MKADQRIDAVGGDLLFPLGPTNSHPARRDLDHLARHARGDLTSLDAILEVRAQPVLHALRPLFAAVDDRGARTRAEQLEGGLDRRVLPADNDDVAPVREMRLVEVMMDMRQLFAPPPDAEVGWVVEVARCEGPATPRKRLPA